jgi:UDP-2-acetamido-2-deoxy-ribo-hexuluronate aminotransferase
MSVDAPLVRPAPPVALIDLQAQRRRIGREIDMAIQGVLAHGNFIMGPEVARLEQQLADFCGARHAVACSSGTDALALVLMAKGVGPGDAVLVPTFTFASTAEVVPLTGATPIFVDVRENDFNIDPDSLARGVATARHEGLRPAGVIAVDLFGLPADYAAIEPLCAREGLWLMDDAAQSFGAVAHGRCIGTIGDATATSFFPAKPLGCYGDGGAVFTQDEGLARTLRSLRVHGKGRDKYDNVAVGINGRLDTLQAAILIEKLKIFADEIEARNHLARRYGEALAGVVEVPHAPGGVTSVWAQYTIKLAAERRDAVADLLDQRGIRTAVYYPIPLHRQTAYKRFPTAAGGAPVAESLSRRVLSLPMYPYLSDHEQNRVIDALRSAISSLEA